MLLSLRGAYQLENKVCINIVVFQFEGIFLKTATATKALLIYLPKWGMGG